MNKTERRDFVEVTLQAVIDKAREDILLEYGGWNLKTGEFQIFEHDVSSTAYTEAVRVRYRNQAPEFGKVQGIEADGYLWIVKDVLKAIERL